MRYRIMVRGKGIELRGYIDGDHETVNAIISDLNTFGVATDAMIIFSLADDHYNPFALEDM